MLGRIFMNYDVTSEYMMLGLAIVVMLLILVSRPRSSRMMTLVIAGLCTGIVEILVHQVLLYITVAPVFYRNRFLVVYVIYCLLYISLLNIIYSYIILLSYQRRTQVGRHMINITVFSVIYLCILFYPIITDHIYMFDPQGKLHFLPQAYSINVCGMLTCIFALITVFIDRRTVSRIVFVGVCIFAPIEFLVLWQDAYFQTVYFVSYTYVLPFVIYYALFHSYRYDEVAGCQSSDAIYTQIEHAIRKDRHYLLMNATFPQLQKREYEDLHQIIDYISSKICREIERLNPGIRFYSSSIYSYSLFCPVKSDEEADKIVENVNRILHEPMKFNQVAYRVYFKEIILRDNERLSTVRHVSSMMGYLRTKISGNTENEYIIADEKTYEQFEDYYEVEQALLDIKAKGDLDDERILCYVHPIYDIAEQKFTSGEALMRLQLGNRIYPPDLCISIAENNNAIHSLTRIMLNKVCQLIRQLEEDGHDFRAITVNCSTMELEDRNFHKELTDIIERHGIQPRHIRIEITESTMTGGFDSILYNMNKLTEKGISFYLDDFGTGYSNLERISSCPFRTVKFDKSILYNALENPKIDDMLRMLVAFFAKNGMENVIEGVEDEQQFEYCRDVGFDFVQGYYFSRPMPAEELRQWLWG